MTLLRIALPGLFAVALLTACPPDEDAPPDDSSMSDAGVTDDGSTPPFDSGVVPLDSGVVPDIGMKLDADVTPEDAGVVMPEDAGVVMPEDAGIVMPEDAGMIVPDASVPRGTGTSISYECFVHSTRTTSLVPSTAAFSRVNIPAPPLPVSNQVGIDDQANLLFLACDSAGSVVALAWNGTAWGTTTVREAGTCSGAFSWEPARDGSVRYAYTNAALENHIASFNACTATSTDVTAATGTSMKWGVSDNGNIVALTGRTLFTSIAGVESTETLPTAIGFGASATDWAIDIDDAGRVYYIALVPIDAEMRSELRLYERSTVGAWAISLADSVRYSGYVPRLFVSAGGIVRITAMTWNPDIRNVYLQRNALGMWSRTVSWSSYHFRGAALIEVSDDGAVQMEVPEYIGGGHEPGDVTDAIVGYFQSTTSGAFATDSTDYLGTEGPADVLGIHRSPAGRVVFAYGMGRSIHLGYRDF